jgi:hypothetical protein
MKVDLSRVEPGGDLVLVYNAHAKPRSRVKEGAAHYAELVRHNCKKCRTFLTLALSSDGGRHWKDIGSVESVVSASAVIHIPVI